MKHALKTAFGLLVVTLILGGCASRNMLPAGAAGKAMLAGNDPISYHTQSAPAKGDPKINATWDGGLYFFVNEANRDLFAKTPEKYAPQYGGYCSNGAPYAIMMGGTADNYKLVNGRLFMFGDANARRYWEMDQVENIRLGDHFWETEMKEAVNATWQSYKRIIFKVPHYKGYEQLEAQWQARPKK